MRTTHTATFFQVLHACHNTNTGRSTIQGDYTLKQKEQTTGTCVCFSSLQTTVQCKLCMTSTTALHTPKTALSTPSAAMCTEKQYYAVLAALYTSVSTMYVFSAHDLQLLHAHQ